MSGYELQYDAACWYPLPDSTDPAAVQDDARLFGDALVAGLAQARTDLDPTELDDLRSFASAVAASRPAAASESFVFLPADIGALGVAHLTVIVPGEHEVYAADDLIASADDALLPPVRTPFDAPGLGVGDRVLTVAAGTDVPPSARIEYLFVEGPAVLMLSAAARSVRDAALMTAALDELLASFRWLEA